MENVVSHQIVNNCFKKQNFISATVERIWSEISQFRRTPHLQKSCDNLTCKSCSSHFLSRIKISIEKNEPISLVLPAFPGKSPNQEKVLGVLPDFAEELSLKFLNNLCERVKEYYKPGAKIILCSDGRVFSDVVGIKESDITSYQVELDRMIKKMSLKNISTFNLDDFYYNLSFIQMRDELMKKFGTTLDFLKFKIKKGNSSLSSFEEREANRMYCGITRFLFEDSAHSNQVKSRSLLQKEARIKAYEVIRRSNAWSELIEKYFPNSVRLSIHPQTCGSKKLGIRLIGDENWMTPWHGVAVETQKGFVLMKRAEAQKLGAELVLYPCGRSSHYRLMSERGLFIRGV